MVSDQNLEIQLQKLFQKKKYSEIVMKFYLKQMKKTDLLAYVICWV